MATKDNAVNRAKRNEKLKTDPRMEKMKTMQKPKITLLPKKVKPKGGSMVEAFGKRPRTPGVTLLPKKTAPKATGIAEGRARKLPGAVPLPKRVTRGAINKKVKLK